MASFGDQPVTITKPQLTCTAPNFKKMSLAYRSGDAAVYDRIADFTLLENTEVKEALTDENKAPLFQNDTNDTYYLLFNPQTKKQLIGKYNFNVTGAFNGSITNNTAIANSKYKCYEYTVGPQFSINSGSITDYNVFRFVISLAGSNGDSDEEKWLDKLNNSVLIGEQDVNWHLRKGLILFAESNPDTNTDAVRKLLENSDLLKGLSEYLTKDYKAGGKSRRIKKSKPKRTLRRKNSTRNKL